MSSAHNSGSAAPPVAVQPMLDGLGQRAGRRPRPRAGIEPAAELPVARVVLDLTPAHLDRTYDYVVPESMDADARPGVRVRARFGAQQVTGYLLERVAESTHPGELAPLRAVVSPERVLTPTIERLARQVAAHYAGTLPDVLRLAIPPRHARAEKPPPPPAEPAGPVLEPAGPVRDHAGPVPESAGAAAEHAGPVPEHAGPAIEPDISATSRTRGLRVDAAAWRGLRGGPALVQHLTAGGAPRAVWTALPGLDDADWPAAIAQLVAVTVVAGRGALVVVPDARDIARVAEALERVGVPAWQAPKEGVVAPDATFVRLQADDGPAMRYRSFLAALRGHATVVVGTRAAAFAPVTDLGLIVCWDDGDSLHSEPRSPYPHVREVLAMRAEIEASAYVIGSFARSAGAQQLVERGWAHPVQADRAVVRARAPRVRALDSVETAREGAVGRTRLPEAAHRAITAALTSGPVLVQVPRAGYLPVVACARCRAVAHCGRCAGTLRLDSAGATPGCTWCGALATGWRCAECGHGALRSVSVGSSRTAEELGRAFPGVRVRQSGSGPGVLDQVGPEKAIIVATPGAEPPAAGGYSLVLLLDAAVASGRPGLDSGLDAVRLWFGAAALGRAAEDGGVVLLVGDGAPGPSQALVRWDPASFAEHELAERRTLRLPPTARLVTVTGRRDAVDAVVGRLELPPGAEVLGPVHVPDESGTAPGGRRTADPAVQGVLDVPVRTIVRVPFDERAALARTVHASLAVRSARREGGTVQVRLDAADLL